jgi:predicted aconitase
MDLTRSEERALAGEYGQALEIAYRVLVAIARLTNATRLIPVTWAHVSGVSYLTIGDYGLDFIQKISKMKGTKFKVFTTLNPCGMDVENWDRLEIPAEYAEKQFKIINAYQKLGVANSFTCIPFQSFEVPKKGTHVAWAESSAAIFANSILGIKTNRESAVSALASALTGKTVYSDLHIDRNREPTFAVRIKLHEKARLAGSLAYGILGYYSGKHGKGVIEFQGIRKVRSMGESKALCASIGTVGSSGMFTVGNTKGIEAIDFTDKEYESTFDEISDSETGDAIVFGCPQMTVEELYELSKRLEGKHFAKRCVVFCSSKVYELAKSRGYVGYIEKAGATFVRDACADFTPLISSLKVDSILTDSIKGAHYMKRVHGVMVALKDTETILKENLN